MLLGAHSAPHLLGNRLQLLGKDRLELILRLLDRLLDVVAPLLDCGGAGRFGRRHGVCFGHTGATQNKDVHVRASSKLREKVLPERRKCRTLCPNLVLPLQQLDVERTVLIDLRSGRLTRSYPSPHPSAYSVKIRLRCPSARFCRPGARFPFVPLLQRLSFWKFAFSKTLDRFLAQLGSALLLPPSAPATAAPCRAHRGRPPRTACSPAELPRGSQPSPRRKYSRPPSSPPSARRTAAAPDRRVLIAELVSCARSGVADCISALCSRSPRSAAPASPPMCHSRRLSRTGRVCAPQQRRLGGNGTLSIALWVV